jgi:hypothetical protein
VIVKNKDGRPRFCVDYRRLNAVTKDEAAPLPIIQETLRDLGQSEQYTAFSTPDDGLYQFCVMPFELKGVPSTFQRLICQEVLPSHLRKFTMVYLDHIVGYSESYEKHLRRLRLVFRETADTRPVLFTTKMPPRRENNQLPRTRSHHPPPTRTAPPVVPGRHAAKGPAITQRFPRTGCVTMC